MEAKKWGSVHASGFQLAVPVLKMLCEDALGKNCPKKALFDPPLQKQTLCEASFTHVLRPFRKTIFSYGVSGADTAPCLFQERQNSVSRSMLYLSSLF